MDKQDFKFDKRASTYDQGFEGKLSKRFYRLIYENVILRNGDRIIDIGCGTGTILKTLSGMENIDAHGIDVEPEMLKVAKAKCSNMDIRECSCEDTPYEDNSFDVMTACMAYHHFPDKDGFAKEASRIIRQNGTLYIADPNFPLPIRKIMNFLAKSFNGEFLTSQEIANRFTKYGFIPAGTVKDHYAQLVILRKA